MCKHATLLLFLSPLNKSLLGPVSPSSYCLLLCSHFSKTPWKKKSNFLLNSLQLGFWPHHSILLNSYSQFPVTVSFNWSAILPSCGLRVATHTWSSPRLTGLSSSVSFSQSFHLPSWVTEERSRARPRASSLFALTPSMIFVLFKSCGPPKYFSSLDCSSELQTHIHQMSTWYIHLDGY